MEFTDFLKQQIDLAMKTMLGSGESVKSIPNANGMVLVLDGTAEADERKKEAGVIVGTVTDAEKTFLVCNK